MTPPLELLGINWQPVIVMLGTVLTMGMVALPGSARARLSGWRLWTYLVTMGGIVPTIGLAVLGHFRWLGV